jgi:NAD(P) transhydrogenase
MPHYDLICLGSGPAGEKAATQAAYFGKTVAVVERSRQPGGTMVNTGTVASKALRETALLCSSFRRRPLPGIDFSLDRTVSITRFMARKHLVQLQEHDRIESSFDRHRITVHRGRGTIIDPHTVEVVDDSGAVERISGEAILIATGSSPLRPDYADFSTGEVVDAEGVLELKRMPASLMVVGGGVIGSEYACIFAEMGVDVTILEPRDAILPFLDEECRAILLRAMIDTGIKLRMNAPVAKACGGGPGGRITLQSGEELKADVVLWALGRSGNTKGLGLENVGLIPDNRGQLKVNECFQTSVPSIYAAGDVIGFPALASTSMEQGRIAACKMFGIPFKERLTSTVPIGIYTIPSISCVGLQESEAQSRGKPVVVGRARYQANVRGRMLGDETGMLKMVFDRESRVLLGASIVGEDATELIHVAQSGILGECTIEDYIQSCYNYPSLTEMYKYGAYSALQAIAAEEKAIPLSKVA